SPHGRGAAMERWTSRLATALAVVAALALAAGCGRKPPARPPDPGTVTPPITEPFEDGSKPVQPKDGNGVPDFPKVETPAPLFDAIALTRKLISDPDAASALRNKLVQVEGVVATVDLRPAGNNPDDARVTLHGATDDPDQRKHVKVVCGLRDK